MSNLLNSRKTFIDGNSYSFPIPPKTSDIQKKGNVGQGVKPVSSSQKPSQSSNSQSPKK